MEKKIDEIADDITKIEKDIKKIGKKIAPLNAQLKILRPSLKIIKIIKYIFYILGAICTISIIFLIIPLAEFFFGMGAWAKTIETSLKLLIKDIEKKIKPEKDKIKEKEGEKAKDQKDMRQSEAERRQLVQQGLFEKNQEQEQN